MATQPKPRRKTTARSRSRAPVRRGTDVRTTRGASSRDEALISEAEVQTLVDEGMALAEQAVGKSRVQMLWNIAPTLATVAARYVRREPAKAALAVLVFGGLLLVGRSLLGASGTASASKAHAGLLAG